MSQTALHPAPTVGSTFALALGSHAKPGRASTLPKAFALAACQALLLASVALGAQPAPPAKSAIDPALAGRYFAEAKSISDKDGGRLWGAPLYGAMLFVDDNTREVVANRPDYQNLLTSQGEVFVGTLPSEENTSNTAMRWAGITWTMLRWPLPDDAFERDKIMIHESFHRIQDELGLGGPDTSCDHLDTRDGRVWLQLEWRALRSALLAQGAARKKAIQDALVFRSFRRSLFDHAAAAENALEIHEGLPEYTGIVLCAKTPREAAAYAASRLMGASSMSTFVRSFAYVTGPAYGLLLDDFTPAWRKGLKATDDLGTLLGTACGESLPADLKTAAAARATAYGSKELTASEDKLAAQKASQLAAYRARFVEGPVLVLPIAEGFNYAFNPTDQVPLAGHGTVYPYLRISAAWGVMEATQGALMLLKDSMITGAQVPAPKDTKARPLKGDGWTLDLKDGWALVPGARPGDLTLKRTALAQP